ncbi:MAG: DUF2344 domain-containing protein [Firmicutes bacterium]|nr:DUF2344 domain-containing protein [Bacillota bacterium]
MGKSIRVRFQVKETCRFISHLDKVRSFERAIRRAQLPIAYSQGFNRRPRFAFAQALPVGVTSDAEYADFHLTEYLEAERLKIALNQVLPSGFYVLEAVNLPARAEALMTIIQAAAYRIKLLEQASELPDKIGNLLAQKSIYIDKHTKKGSKQVNIRPWIYQLELNEDGTELSLVCACGSQGNLRPMDILEPLGLKLEEVLIHREALWIEMDPVRRTPIDIVGG